MNPHDYIISVNENGEPYLEHALFGRGSIKDNHKWFARERVRDKWRYWYSPEEYRAWQQGRTRQARSEKKVSNTDKMRSAFKQLKETGRKAVDVAADKLGVDERQALQNANRFNRARRQKAIDEAVRQTPISGSQSTKSKDEPLVSEEYKQDMELNSRKNNYFRSSGESSGNASSQIYEENAAKKLELQRSNDKKDAQRASAMVDHYFAEMTKLTDRYMMMYGDNWESRISSKEREALQKSIDELDRHQKDADAKWDSYNRKWASTK